MPIPLPDNRTLADTIKTLRSAIQTLEAETNAVALARERYAEKEREVNDPAWQRYHAAMTYQVLEQAKQGIHEAEARRKLAIIGVRTIALMVIQLWCGDILAAYLGQANAAHPQVERTIDKYMSVALTSITEICRGGLETLDVEIAEDSKDG